MARNLTIYSCLFTQSDCYRSGVRQKTRGIQIHSTGANNPNLSRYVQPDDGRLGLNANGNSHNRPGGDVCASAYIGKLSDGTVAVYQTLPWDMRCWLSGNGNNGNANRLGYIGFEICEDTLNSEDYFQAAVMTAAVNLTAHLCDILDIAPRGIVETFGAKRAMGVMDHSELSAVGLASGHADIGHWLRRYSKNMDDFRREVEQAMTEGVNAVYVPQTDTPGVPVNELYEVFVTNGGYVNLRAQMDTASASLARLRPGERVLVLTRFSVWSQVEYGEVSGYVMNEFLQKVLEDPSENGSTFVITDSGGNVFYPVGDFTVSHRPS